MYEKVFSAYITNLGKYAEGQLIGRWVDFPTTKREIQTVLREIGIDRVRYEEIFITDYESEISGLTDCLGAYESFSTLNYLAHKIQEADYGTEYLEALLELGEYTGNVTELLTLLDNIDCFLIYMDIEGDYDLGYYLIHETGLYGDLQGNIGVLADYIDYEAYGRDVRLEEGGVYTQNDCYVCLIGNPVAYSMEEIPEENRVGA